MPELQTTTLFHNLPFRRNGVKYNQCGIAPKYAPIRDSRVLDCTTSPVTFETYTSSPSGHEYFQRGRSLRNSPLTVHWSGWVIIPSNLAALAGRPVHADAMRKDISCGISSCTEASSA